MRNQFSAENNRIKFPHYKDYYKKKERRLISRPQYIQQSFELCAEDLNNRLLVYQNQSHEYRRGCVQGEPVPFIMLRNYYYSNSL